MSVALRLPHLRPASIWRPALAADPGVSIGTQPSHGRSSGGGSLGGYRRMMTVAWLTRHSRRGRRCAPAARRGCLPSTGSIALGNGDRFATYQAL